VAAGFAILTRPNLAPVALAPGLYLLLRVFAPGADRRAGFGRVAAFGVPAAMGALGVAAIHTLLYGSPLRTGYGRVTTVYSAEHASSWLAGWMGHPLKFDLVLLALALIGAAIVLARPARPGARSLVLTLALVVVLVLGAHAFYPPSPDWWYLRFLMTLYPPLAALGGVGIVALSARISPRWTTAAAMPLVAALVAHGVWRADDWRAFDQREIEARYQTIGRFVRETLPERAAFLAFHHSGSLRYYADRVTMRYTQITPGSLDSVVRFLAERGYRPYFVIEDPEKARFKQRFGSKTDLGLLDWPPAAELRGPVRISIYDPSDRARWYGGVPLVPVLIAP
jgi:hypothetical protein